MSKVVDFIQYLVQDELSYNISRPYGLGRWFKLYVLLGSVVILSFLTLFNLATNGYDKQLKYTTDPNSTESELHWYNNKFFTWGDDNLDPKCQNNEIPVGHEFITTNLGLRYTVRKILYFPPDSKDGLERASVSYHKNMLLNCDLKTIKVNLKKVDPPRQDDEYRWWSWMESSADATAQCDILNDDGFFRLEFLVIYNAGDDYYTYLSVDNASTHAPFWWGARLLNTYFAGIKYFMSASIPADNLTFIRATLGYEHSDVTSMKDPKLFGNWFSFIDSDGGINDSLNRVPENGQPYNNPNFNYSRPLTEGFFFAKIFRSLILVDLGNSTAPNLLLDPDLLQYALDPGKDDFNRLPEAPLRNESKVDWRKYNSMPPPGQPLNGVTAVPLHETYAKFKNQTGKLETREAFIYAQYICTVPQRKPTSAMVLSTLVANLAIFQTAWAFFKYGLDRKVMWKDPTANWCERCLIDRHVLQQMSGENNSSVDFQSSDRRRSSQSSNHELQMMVGESNSSLDLRRTDRSHGSRSSSTRGLLIEERDQS